VGVRLYFTKALLSQVSLLSQHSGGATVPNISLYSRAPTSGIESNKLIKEDKGESFGEFWCLGDLVALYT